MNTMQKNLWLVATIVFAACMTVATLSYIVTEPWHVLPDIGGDGAKNNFTYLYHALFGKGYWFDGMNYPYGEHIVFTDGQPLLSVFFATTGNTDMGTALTTCWWLLGFSYILSIVYIYKTLTGFKVAPFAAMIFAGLIGVCTPQLMCIRGHYALAYTCVVPMIFYWNVQYHSSGKLRYCLWFFITGCIVSFLHPYYAAMMLVWAAAYAAGYFLFTMTAIRAKVLHSAPLMGSVIGVLLVIAIVMKLTDPATDRPVTPFNPMEANTHIKQIVTSGYSPIWKAAERAGMIWKASDGGEGFTYLGLVPIGAILLFWGLLALKKMKKWDAGVQIGTTGFSPIWLFVAFSVLALSMGIPFIWNMKWLMNYISFFKQFRALGRFSWIFYYVATIYGVVVLYSIHRRIVAAGKPTYGFAMLTLALAVWSIEASGYMAMSRQVSREGAYNFDLMISKHEQKWASWLSEQQYSATDFQAILVLKLYHIGSEKLWVGDGAWSNTLATRAGLQLHLPLVDVMMSRTSWSQTKKQVKIAGGPYADKPMLRELPNRKPFLLLRFNEDSLDADQSYLLSVSKPIGHFSQCDVYCCYPDSIVASDNRHAAEILSILPYLSTGDTCIRGSGTWSAQHYDKHTTTPALWGQGAAPHIQKDDSVIASVPVQAAGDSQLYELSAWFLLGDKDPKSPYVDISLIDGKGNQIRQEIMNTKLSVDNYEMWFRASSYFYIPHNCKTLKLTLVNTPNPAYLAMDEFLLRPAGSVIVSKSANGSILVNNHQFKNRDK